MVASLLESALQLFPLIHPVIVRALVTWKAAASLDGRSGTVTPSRESSKDSVSALSRSSRCSGSSSPMTARCLPPAPVRPIAE